MKKIGLLTSGGDCQGLNAALRGVAKGLYTHYGEQHVTVYGINDGYKGLINENITKMKPDDFSGILNLGGTILGTSRQPFKQMRVIDNENITDKVSKMKENYYKIGFDCLVILGGNGTHKTANLLREEGLNVVTLPKTIDNDLWGTDYTFGFQSAVDIATDVIERIRTTANSHSRVFIIELMGHKAGWLTLYAGIGGGADVILIPEIPYNINSIHKVIKTRQDQGMKFSIIVAAEGVLSQEEAKLSKKEFKLSRSTYKMPGISYRIGEQLTELTGQEIRVTVPGHFQRGGSPCPFDKILASRLGASAAELIIKHDFGKMVAIKNNNIIAVPLSEIAGKLKMVPTDNDEIKAAKLLGVSFGD